MEKYVWKWRVIIQGNRGARILVTHLEAEKQNYVLEFWIQIPWSVQWLSYRLDNWGLGIDLGGGKDFSLFATASKLALGSTQPPIQWASGAT